MWQGEAVGGEGMKEGVGRKVVLLNKITSYGWNGLVTVFSTVESQTISAKQKSTTYTVRMEEKEKVVATRKPGHSSSELGVWHLDRCSEEGHRGTQPLRSGRLLDCRENT